MKRFSAFLLALALPLAAVAAPGSDTLSLGELRAQLAAHPEKLGNNHLNYPFAPYRVAPAPKGYTPVYISHYGRHGSRYITSSVKYDQVMSVLQKAKDAQALTPEGETLYARYSTLYPRLKGHNGDLTDKGEAQHRALVHRMVEAYPAVFGKTPVVDARSTVVPRAIISMMSFCDALREERPGMRLSYAADYADLPVTALAPDPAQPSKNFEDIYRNAYLGGALMKATGEIGLDADAFCLRYFKDLEPLKDVCTSAELVSFLGEIDGTAQCLDFDATLGDLFTEEEAFQVWENSNLYAALMFADTPYTKGLLGARAWSLLADIISLADEDLASGGVQVRLRFGHDTVVAPLMDLLGIDGWEPLGEDMTRWKYSFQGWNIPMASNVQLVFYRNKKNPSDILVRLMYNEKDQILPLEDQSLAPYYRWEDFKAHYAPVVDEARSLVEGFYADNPVLSVEGGKVQGVPEDDVLVYKGIPFAAPPVGDLRGKAPQRVQPWKGILQADTFAPAALQDPFPKDDPIYYREFYEGEDIAYSEDCLYLNVWAPAATVNHPEAGLPVAVWIHGGAFTHGYSYEKEFDGMEWARRGVILVTIPYRVGDLGFGPDGQLGFRDQIAALEWVQRNIRTFGGDPANVTIMGQSAGAISVKYLFTFPEAQSLFAKAVMHSGGGVNDMSVPPILPEGTRGEIIPAAVEAGCFDRKPILMGWVAQDPGFLGKETVTVFGDVLSQRAPSRPVYLYDFRRNLPGEGPGEMDWGAFHTFELWYTFGTLPRSWRPFTEGDYDLSRRMLDAWTSFAKSSDPGWKPYSAADPYVQVFDVE